MSRFFARGFLSCRDFGARHRHDVGGETDIQFHAALVFSVRIRRSRSSFGSPCWMKFYSPMRIRSPGAGVAMSLPFFDQLQVNRRIAVWGRLLTGRIAASVRMLIQRSLSSISWRA